MHILIHTRLEYGKNETHNFEEFGAVLLKRQNKKMKACFSCFTSSVLSINPTNLRVQTITPFTTMSYQIHYMFLQFVFRRCVLYHIN